MFSDGVSAGSLDTGNDSTTARQAMVSQLTAVIQRATAEGDGETARVAHEALGQLLGAPVAALPASDAVAPQRFKMSGS